MKKLWVPMLVGLLFLVGFGVHSGVDPLAALQEASCVQLAQQTNNPNERAVFNFIQSTLQASQSTKDLLCQALRDGFNKSRITSERALSLLQRINQSTAPLEQREGVLLVVAQTLLTLDLPVEMIVSKIEEGMAKGVPMSEILKEISERMLALKEVRDFLLVKGIKVGAEVAGTQLKLTVQIVDRVITDTTGALEDWVRNAKNPEQAAQDASGIKAAVLSRLEMDPQVPRELFSFISKQINDPASGWLSGLVQIAMNIAARIKK